jgi:hypothetical protein
MKSSCSKEVSLQPGSLNDTLSIVNQSINQLINQTGKCDAQMMRTSDHELFKALE